MNSSSNASDIESNATWNQFAPLLDDAMQQLPETDRLAILLRYFQNQPLREVGVALGLEEDTARKRVSRALDKLRDWFSARGIVSTSIGLAGVISTNAVQAVPLGITDALIKASLVTGTLTAGSSVLSTTSIMASTKAVLVTAAIIATALTIPLLSQRSENRELQHQIQNTSDEIIRLKARNATLATAQVSADELARLRINQAELLRLRAEVGRLRRDLQAKLVESTKSSTDVLISQPPEQTIPSEPKTPFTANVNARIPLGNTFITGGWETKAGTRTLVFVTPSMDPSGGSPNQIIFESVLADVTEDALLKIGILGMVGTVKTESSIKGMLTSAQFAVIKKALSEIGGSDLLTAPMIMTLNERQAQVSVGTPPTISIDLLPSLTPDQTAIDLTVSVNLRQPEPAPKK